ncbi:MAG TPA: L,D-transpeptidase family protein [Ramlibacter sp.]|jgi:lipoprotein-anchoring transpeptidase ErfK/SrfK
MPSKKSFLRASALLLPLVFAAPPVLLAKPAAPAAAGAKASAYRQPFVAASIPVDATEHMNELNADTGTPDIGPGAKGPAVLRAQVLLDRAWFSPGEIDGSYGRNMRFATAAFQMSRGLPQTGIVDAATWQALAQVAQKPAFGTYVLTEQDVAGPYAKTPEDPKEQGRMERLGYQDAMEALSERFHVKPALLAELNRGRTVTAGQMIVVPDVNVPIDLAAKATLVRVDKSDKMLYVLGEGDRVLGAFPVSIGGMTNDLPVNTVLSIVNEVKNPNYMYDPALLKNPKTDAKVRLPPGPNNPVGVAWLGLDRQHWGIHGTPEPSQMARVETNGCIRLTNWDVLRLATVAGKGIPVHVQA